MSKAVLDALVGKFGDAILETSDACGDDTVVVAANKLLEVATYLRDDEAMAFDSPVFCTCTDWLGMRTDGPRFEVNYQLRSVKKRHRLRIKIRLEEAAPTLPTLSSIWPGFDWQERETFDMYGIIFEGHPDLRRIYMYEEFEGHPLRKDYPKDKRQPLVRREWGNE